MARQPDNHTKGMMRMKQILQKLKNPAVLFSVLSQIVAILILVGVNINEDTAMTFIGIGMSILATLGIIGQNQNKQKPPELELDYLPCANTGDQECHIMIDGQMTCVKCGAKYIPPK